MNGLDVNSANILYNGMLKPAMLYGIILWKNKDKTKLDTIHFNAASICLGTKKQCGNALLLFELNWHSLESHRIKFAIQFLHRTHQFSENHRIKEQLFEAFRVKKIRDESIFWGFAFSHAFKMCEFNNLQFENFAELTTDSCKLYTISYLENIRENKWLNENRYRHFRQIKPTSNHDNFSKFIKHTTSRIKQTIIAQLRSGQDFLNHSFYSENEEDKLCDNCDELESLHHFLKICPKYNVERAILSDELATIGLDFQTLTIYELLGNNEEDVNTVIAIFDAISNFAISTGRPTEQQNRYNSR